MFSAAPGRRVLVFLPVLRAGEVLVEVHFLKLLVAPCDVVRAPEWLKAHPLAAERALRNFFGPRLRCPVVCHAGLSVCSGSNPLHFAPTARWLYRAFLPPVSLPPPPPFASTLKIVFGLALPFQFPLLSRFLSSGALRIAATPPTTAKSLPYFPSVPFFPYSLLLLS